MPFLSNGLEFRHGNQHESSLVSSEQDSVKKQDLTLRYSVTSAIQWWFNAEDNPTARSAWNPKTKAWEEAPSSGMQPKFDPNTGELNWIDSSSAADIAFRGEHVASLSSCSAFLDCVSTLENGVANYKVVTEQTGKGQIPEVEIEIVKDRGAPWMDGRVRTSPSGGLKVTVPVVDFGIKIGIQNFCSSASVNSCIRNN